MENRNDERIGTMTLENNTCDNCGAKMLKDGNIMLDVCNICGNSYRVEIGFHNKRRSYIN